MSLQVVREAVEALVAAGSTVSIKALQEALPGVGRSTIGRHLSTIRAEAATADTVESGGDVAVATEVSGTAEELALQRIVAAQERLAMAQGTVQGLEEERTQTLTQRLGVARQTVAQQAQDLKDAERHLATVRKQQVEAEVRASDEGQMLLESMAQIAEMKRQSDSYETAGAFLAYASQLQRLQHEFNNLVQQRFDTLYPKPPAIETPLRRLTRELEEARTESNAALREMQAYERDDNLMASGPYSDQRLPYRQARERWGNASQRVEQLKVQVARETTLERERSQR
jgi:hypothetical protein